MQKLILFAVATAISAPAMAAPGDSATGTGAATAEVVSPITLTHVTGASLNFGTFTTGSISGSILVDQAGNGSVNSGDVTLVSGSTEAADQFTVGGDSNRAFTITTGAGSVSNGTDTMAFSTSAPASGTLVGGAASFSVGGELFVNGGESAGVYNGSYSVTVAYN